MNRYRKIGLLLFVVLLVIAAGSILTNKLSGSTFESLDVTDQQMLEELANIYKTFEENSDKLWTEDYRIDEGRSF